MPHPNTFADSLGREFSNSTLDPQLIWALGVLDESIINYEDEENYSLKWTTFHQNWLNADRPPKSLMFRLNNNSGTAIGYPTGLRGNCVMIIQLNPVGGHYFRYSAQLAFGFGADRLAIRRIYGGGEDESAWGPWKYITFTETS